MERAESKKDKCKNERKTGDKRRREKRGEKEKTLAKAPSLLSLGLCLFSHIYRAFGCPTV